MLNVSENAATVINSDGRTFKARITVDGQIITDSIKRILFTYGTCGASAFAFGSVFKSCAEIVLSELDISLADKEMLIEIGVLINTNVDTELLPGETLYPSSSLYPDESQIEKVVEFVPMGYFKADKQNIKIEKNKVTVKAYDRLGNNGTYIPTVEFPETIQNVIADIANQMGVQIITELDTSSIIEKPIESGTFTSVLQVISGLLGGIVVCDRTGKVVITEHPRVANVAVNEERCLRPIESSDDKYSIDTLTVIAAVGGTDALGEEAEEISYTHGSGCGISVENEYMTEAIFDEMKNRIVGYSFDPCSLKFMGDPRIEATDALEVTNWAGEVFFVPCMSLVHEFDGGFSTEVSTPSIAIGESGTVGPLQQTVNNLVHDMILAKKVVARQITADRIDVDDLFAQDIKATGTITGANFIGATGSFSGEITAKKGNIGGWTINEFSISSSNNGDMYTEEGLKYAHLNLGYLEFTKAYTEDDITTQSSASLDGSGVKIIGVFDAVGVENNIVLNAYGLYIESDYGDEIIRQSRIDESGFFGTYDGIATSGYFYSIEVGTGGMKLKEINPHTGTYNTEYTASRIRMTEGIDETSIFPSLISTTGKMSANAINSDTYITCGTRIYLPNGNALRGMNNGYDISEVSTSNSSVIGYISTSDRAILGSAANTQPTEVRSPGALYLKCAGTTADDDNRYALTFLRVNFGSSDSPTYYGCLRPRIDNYTVLGSSSLRFRNVFSTNGVSTTSDRNKKDDIKELDDIYIQLFDELKPVTYKLIDGGERTHVGFISQDVEDAMNKIGMSPMDFAGFCKDIIADDEGNPILDKNGNVQYYYSLRYSEFTPVNTAKIQQVENKMDNQFEKDEEWKKQIEAKIEKILEHL